MEIEAKFVAAPAVFDALRRLPALGPFQLIAQADLEVQRNIYYDTADGRMRATKHGLRVRQIGARQIATLKSAATLTDGIASRGEWEQDVPGNDPQAWPEGELRSRVLALIGETPLLPILEMETQRQHIYALRDAARVAEISLDEGVFVVGQRREPFQELEVELLEDGQRTNFDALIALLRAQFPLSPEPRSKLERGLMVALKR
ncbi:MAG: CYTH domain-containing protein [Roseiflexaceae bacterium]|nr:CYTH domain-containing protein [Roseiflexaceae bacterium]